MATRASSEQKCVKVRVEEEAAPSFLLGQASGGSEVFVMGRRKDISITLGSPNCLADIRLATGPGTPLPEGADLSLVSSTRAG